jgi:hypothetical protein
MTTTTTAATAPAKTGGLMSRLKQMSSASASIKVERQPQPQPPQQQEQKKQAPAVASAAAAAAAVEDDVWTDSTEKINMQSLISFLPDRKKTKKPDAASSPVAAASDAPSAADASRQNDDDKKKKLNEFKEKHNSTLLKVLADAGSGDKTAAAASLPAGESAPKKNGQKAQGDAAKKSRKKAEAEPAVAAGTATESAGKKKPSAGGSGGGRKRKQPEQKQRSQEDDVPGSSAAAAAAAAGGETVDGVLDDMMRKIADIVPPIDAESSSLARDRPPHPLYNPVEPSNVLGLATGSKFKMGNIKQSLAEEGQQQHRQQKDGQQQQQERGLPAATLAKCEQRIAKASMEDFVSMTLASNYETDRPEFLASASHHNLLEMIANASTDVSGASVDTTGVDTATENNRQVASALRDSFESTVQDLRNLSAASAASGKGSDAFGRTRYIPVVKTVAAPAASATGTIRHEYMPSVIPDNAEEYGGVFDENIRSVAANMDPFTAMERAQRIKARQQQQQDDGDVDMEDGNAEDDDDGTYYYCPSDDDVDDRYADPFSHCSGISSTPYIQTLANSLFRQQQQKVAQERHSGVVNTHFPDYPLYSVNVCAMFLHEPDPTNPRQRPCCYAQQIDASDEEYKVNPLKNNCRAFKDFGITLREFIPHIDDDKPLPEERVPCLFCDRFTTTSLFWKARANNEQVLSTVIQSHGYKYNMPGGYKLEYMLPQVRTFTGLMTPFLMHSSMMYYVCDNVATCKANRNIPLRGLRERDYLFFQQ